jgi:hypothetical protein
MPLNVESRLKAREIKWRGRIARFDAGGECSVVWIGGTFPMESENLLAIFLILSALQTSQLSPPNHQPQQAAIPLWIEFFSPLSLAPNCKMYDDLIKLLLLLRHRARYKVKLFLSLRLQAVLCLLYNHPPWMISCGSFSIFCSKERFSSNSRRKERNSGHDESLDFRFNLIFTGK